MRVYSRKMVVGVLLGLAAILSGCQPVQPISATTASVSEISVTSEPKANIAVISDSMAVDENVDEIVVETPTVASEPLTATVVAVATEDVTVDATVTMTPDVVESVDPALLEAGMATYRAQYCGICHTLTAAETRGTFGPEHDGMGTIAAERIADSSYSGAAATPAEYIRESIVEPQAYLVPGYATTSHRMPPYAHLDAATLDGLVAFLLAQ